MRGRSKKILGENRICITGLRRSKVPAVRTPLLSLFVLRSWVRSPFFFACSPLGKWYSNDRAAIFAAACFRFPSVRTLKLRCNVLLHSHESLGGYVVSGAAAALRRSGFASSSFGYSTSLHYMICGYIRRVRMKDGAISSHDVRG